MIWINAIYEFLSNHVLVVSLLSACGGALIADFLKFREYFRGNIKDALDKLAEARAPLDRSLRKFSDKALGRNATTSEDYEELRNNVTALRESALSLTNKYPSLRGDFNELSESLVALQKAAQLLSGVLDGKPFVQAVAKYYENSNKLIQKAGTRQQKWVSFHKLRRS